jgi:hypothetical protein
MEEGQESKACATHQMRNIYILVGKLEGKRSPGRPRLHKI